jgi:hypothetical protein
VPRRFLSGTVQSIYIYHTLEKEKKIEKEKEK